jgi:hypothetical protein
VDIFCVQCSEEDRHGCKGGENLSLREGFKDDEKGRLKEREG